MNESRENKEITSKEAGLIVKNMIKTMEQKLADGEKISAAPTGEGKFSNRKED